MKKMICAFVLAFAAATAVAQTDIAKFEGTWKRQYTDIMPRREYIRIENTDDGINVRFKLVNEAFDEYPEAVFHTLGENVHFDGEAIHCVVPHDHWGVKHIYKITVRQGVLYCWSQRIIPEENYMDEATVIYYNENDNW